MAELTVFGFRPGDSPLHRLDPRAKLFLLTAFSMGTLHAAVWPLSAYCVLVWLAAVIARLPVAAAFVEARWLGVLLLFVFFARLFTGPGPPAGQPGWLGLPVSTAAATEAGLICMRMAVVAAAGMVFAAVSRPREIRAAVEWLLTPLPFIPQRRVGLMIGLLVRFVPQVLAELRLTADALRSRGIENRKNPIYRLTWLVVPLLRRVFLTADRLAVAMEARCYSEFVAGPPMRALTSLDIAALTAGLVLLSVGWLG